MTDKKKTLLNKIDYLISKRKAELLNNFPSIHEITDGFVVRFFTEWDYTEDNNGIRFKKLTNPDNPNESVVFFFIPKNVEFSLKGKFYIGCMTCLNGAVNINYKDKNTILGSYSKICVDSDDVTGKAIENTYLITTSDRTEWSEITKGHIKSIGY